VARSRDDKSAQAGFSASNYASLANWSVKFSLSESVSPTHVTSSLLLFNLIRKASKDYQHGLMNSNERRMGFDFYTQRAQSIISLENKVLYPEIV